MTIPNNPVVNAGLLYVNGLKIINSTYSTVAPTLIVVQGAARDSKNVNDIILPSSITIDITKSGANGLDIGDVAVITFYAVYIIGDSTGYNPTAGLFSLATNSVPYLPYGYDMYRRIGWITTTGNGNILSFAQLGVNENRTYYYFNSFDVLVAGASTVYSSVDLSLFVPPIQQANEVMLNVTYTAGTATNRVEFNDFTLGGLFAFGIVQFGTGVAGIQYGSVRVPANAQQTFYRVGTGDLLTLGVSGYTDYL